MVIVFVSLLSSAAAAAAAPTLHTFRISFSSSPRATLLFDEWEFVSLS